MPEFDADPDGIELPEGWEDAAADAMASELCREDFLWFVRAVWPGFIIEEVHILIADLLMKVEAGVVDRAMIFMPPRAGKSQLVSRLFPAWVMGRTWWRSILVASHKKELAEGFGREVRDTIADPDFRLVFDVGIRKDVKAAARWQLIPPANNPMRRRAGEFGAIGVTGGMSGKGFNIGIVDDLLSEEDMESKVRKDRAYSKYSAGFLTRADPLDSAIIVMNTRYAVDDVSGRLLAEQRAAEKLEAEARKAGEEPDEDLALVDRWEVLDCAALIDAKMAERLNAVADHPLLQFGPQGERWPNRFTFRAGDSFAPRRFPLRFLLRRRKNMTARAWAALYMQKPTVEEGAILKRKCWRRWPGMLDARTKRRNPYVAPECVYVLQVYDTAFEEGQENDYSARTTWGIFERPRRDDLVDPECHVVLLERWKDKVGFPELRELAWQSYQEYRPDRVLVEKKASGHSLIQELRKRKVPVKAFDPKSRSKTTRAHAASVVLERGAVWYMDRDWADEVINECAEFPNGENDDIVDTCVMAWLWLRWHFWLGIADDQEVDQEALEAERQAALSKPKYAGSYGSRRGRRAA